MNRYASHKSRRKLQEVKRAKLRTNRVKLLSNQEFYV